MECATESVCHFGGLPRTPFLTFLSVVSLGVSFVTDPSHSRGAWGVWPCVAALVLRVLFVRVRPQNVPLTNRLPSYSVAGGGVRCESEEWGRSASAFFFVDGTLPNFAPQHIIQTLLRPSSEPPGNRHGCCASRRLNKVARQGLRE